MELYIVRHAIAGVRDPVAWPDDSKRPLTPQGEKTFRQAARGLAESAPAPSVVLSSGFARAWRTAQLLRREAHWPAPLACPELEVGHAPQELLEVLRFHATSNIVAVVGHEPYLSELLSYLVFGNIVGARFGFKKGGCACLTLTGSVIPGTAALRWFAPPRFLRALR